MKLKDVSGIWDRLKSWQGRYKKFRVNVSQNQSEDSYYFYVNREEDDVRYNCLWDKIEYNNLDEATGAAVNWIDEKLKTIKKRGEFNG